MTKESGTVRTDNGTIAAWRRDGRKIDLRLVAVPEKSPLLMTLPATDGGIVTEADLLSDIDPVLLRRGDPNASEATFATRVYLAGPMRGIAEFNFPAFDMAAAQLRGAGYAVWSPAEHDRAHGFDSTEMTGHEDLAEYGFSLRDALTRDMAEVAKSDAICLLDGWERSKGAKAEHALAEALWIQTGTLEEYLPVEPMTEHEFLTGEAFRPLVEVDMAKAVVDQIGAHLGADSIFQAEKLDRLDHFLTSGTRRASLFDRYGVVDTPPCSNCDDRKCMDCVFRYVHDECHDDCLDCCNVETMIPVFEDDEVRITSSTGGQRCPAPPWYDMPALTADEVGARLNMVEPLPEMRVTSSTGGQKGTKLARFELIPTRPMWAVAELYGYGASKYQEARNWELGYDWSLSYAALQRHANLFWSREDDDPETSLPHLAAVVFHALALMEYRTTHPEFDDRPER